MTAVITRVGETVDALDMFCVDEATEILTRRGWLTHDHLLVGDEALSINPATQLGEWTPVLDVHRLPAGPRRMMLVEGRTMSSLSTAEHRWFVKRRRGQGRGDATQVTWEFRTSARLDAECSVPTSAPVANLPTEPKYLDALVEVVAWYWTEGHDRVAPQSGVIITQSAVVNPDHCASIRRSLVALFGKAHSRLPGAGAAAAWAEYRQRDYAVFALNTAAGAILRAVAPAKTPTWEFIGALTLAQLNLFIERSLDGDGTRSGVHTFSQKRRELSSIFQAACLMAGRSAHLRVRRQNADYPMHAVALHDRSFVKPLRQARVEWVDHGAMVWCPTTGTGTWLARRNGTTWFTGNCGYGGSSQGIHDAGAELRVAINHDERNIACHAENWPDVDHVQADLSDASSPQVVNGAGKKVPGRYVDPAKLPPARFLWASPSCKFHSPANARKLYEQGPQAVLFDDGEEFDEVAYANSERSRVTMLCFPGKTLVLTQAGLVPISEIEVGTLVLTHRNRWRAVVAKASRFADTITVKGRGHYGVEATPEHPFYVRPNGMRRDAADVPQRQLGAPQWRNAERLGAADSPVRATYNGRFDGWYWATPSAVPSLPVPVVGGSRDLVMDDAFWYFVGRWLGDGNCSFKADGRGKSISIACHRDELEGLRKRLSHGDWAWCVKDQGRAAVVLETVNRALVEWLTEHFGRYAHAKHLPAWALGMPSSHREALLDGYVGADGTSAQRASTQNVHTSITTVSRRLAFGVRLLVESLGHGAGVTLTERIHVEIEGRSITRRPQYLVHWSDVSIAPRTVDDEALRWSKVREIKPGRSNVEVFDIEIEEDASFVADGLVVHNCPVRYAAAHHPELVVVENVVEAAKWGPARDGSTFRWWLREWELLGYEHEALFLNSMFFPPCPQSRDRMYVVFWRRGNTRPDLDYRPRAYCTSDRCQGALVDAVQSWKPRTAAWPLARWGKYRDQYVYRCPDCKLVVEPAAWPALSVIDWSNLGMSLGERRERGTYPAENTVERIAKGFAKLGNGPAMVLPAKSTWGVDRSVAEPFTTQTSQQEKAMASWLAPMRTGNTPVSTAEQLGALAERGDQLFAGAVLPIRSGRPRANALTEQLATVVGEGSHHALIVKANGDASETGYRGKPVTDPLGAVTACPTQQVVTAAVQPIAGNTFERTSYSRARPVTGPVDTLHTSPSFGVSSLIEMRGGGSVESGQHPVTQPAHTVTAGGMHHLLATAGFTKVNGGPGDTSWHHPTDPLNSVTSRDTHALIVVPWIEQWMSDPVAVTDQLATVMSHLRHSLAVAPPIPMEEITPAVLDRICFRMLEPDPELRGAMAFAADYILLGNKTMKTAGLGNAVTPPVASFITGRCLATLGGELVAA